ncbi:MAG: hypothetical protein P9L88_04010 [Candidatus Tantalella remota]|nr:hypothetical protein [Candidatus Tantalella remota]
MKRSLKYILGPILLVSILFCCGTAHAKAPEKGFLVRWWERITHSEVQKPKPPVAEPTAAKETEIEKKQVEFPLKPVPQVKPKAVEKVEEIMPSVKKEKKTAAIPADLAANEPLVKEIEARLKKKPALMETIPNLYSKKSVKDEGFYYYYAPPGETARRLIRLDRETLNGLLKKIDEEKAKVPAKVLPRVPAMLIPKDSKVPVVEALEESEELEKDEAMDTEAEEETLEEEIPLDKDEMLERIEKRLKVYSEIIYIIPGLSFSETDSGGREYFYTGDSGKTLPLDALNKKTLYNLFSRINNEATRINTERLVRQLQQLEQIRRSSQNIPQPPPQPMSPPQVFIPPQPPPRPQMPPQPPRPPAPPAQPPRR